MSPASMDQYIQMHSCMCTKIPPCIPQMHGQWPPMYINAKEIKGDSSCMGAKRAKGGKSTDPRVAVTLWELREQR